MSELNYLNDNNEFINIIKITGKSEVLLNSLLDFYRQNMNYLNYFITQKNILSLRILDWLVTNYSKKYNIIYTLKNNNDIEINFNIYLNYKNQLKAYSKKLFDPFCRRERIMLNVKTLEWIDENNLKNENLKKNSNEFILTTVGQLNFFKWFIQNKVLDYAIDHIKEIDNDMINTLKKNDNYKKIISETKCINNVKKRKELSKCATKNISNLKKDVLVSFD